MDNINYELKDGTVVIYLSGRISSTNAGEVERKINAVMASANGARPVFDADKLTYISSAGLRILMRLCRSQKESIQIINTSPEIYEIFETTGFTELFDVSKKMREIDVSGCEVIGRGFYGTVYRIDEETIVKAYASADSLSMIQNEKRLAKTALIAGVPTAISYDIVKIGDSYGSVFELLRAKTFNDLLIEHPEDVDSITEQFAEFLRIVNSREVPAGRLTSAKEKFIGYLDAAAAHLSPETVKKLRAMFEEIPECNNIVHGDAQMKNVMLADGEPMLIDMDTLSAGNAIFDIQSFYVTYKAFGEHNPNNSRDFLGLSNETVARVWEKCIGYYFGTEDEGRISELRDKVSIVGCVRFLYLLDFTKSFDEFYEPRIKTTVARIEETLKRTDSLLF